MRLTVAEFSRGRYKQAMVIAQDFSVSRGAITVSLAGPIDTEALAARLAPFVRAGDVIALSGDLGAGKTTFARGLIHTLFAAHGLPQEDVPSPTFTLVQEYPFPDFTLFHVDLYRIDTETEIFELGLEEAFTDGVSLIEWPDRLGTLLPSSRLDVTLRRDSARDDEDARQMELAPFGSWTDRLAPGALNG